MPQYTYWNKISTISTIWHENNANLGSSIILSSLLLLWINIIATSYHMHELAMGDFQERLLYIFIWSLLWFEQQHERESFWAVFKHISVEWSGCWINYCCIMREVIYVWPKCIINFLPILLLNFLCVASLNNRDCSIIWGTIPKYFNIWETI